MMEREYTLSKEQVLENLQTTAEGLSTEEAARRAKKYGPNKLKEAEKPTLLQRWRTPVLSISF